MLRFSDDPDCRTIPEHFNPARPADHGGILRFSAGVQSQVDMGIRIEDIKDPRIRLKYIEAAVQSYPSKHVHPTNTQIHSAQLKCDQAQTLDPAMEGTIRGNARIVVRIVGFRIRPLDADNFCGGTKDIVDGLRYAGLIPDDSPEHIILVTEQRKVSTKAEERTEIELLS